MTAAEPAPTVRRPRMKGRREQVVGLRLSDSEHAELVAAAAAAGLTPGGYAAEVTLAAAGGKAPALETLRSAMLREAALEIALTRTAVRRLSASLDAAVAAIHRHGGH